MPSERFRGVQALRTFAALAVVLAHLVGYEARYLPGAPLVPGWFSLGQMGVDLFFVVSGYIVVETTRSLHGSWAGARLFLARRFVRVVPVYWAWLAVVLAAWAAMPGILNAERERDLLASILLLPSARDHVLVVSWTLTFEMFFYLVFGLALPLLRREALPALLGGWAALTVAGALLLRPEPSEPWLTLAFSPLVLEFLAGATVALLRRRVPPQAGLALAAAGLAGLVAGGAVLAAAGAPLSGWNRLAAFGLPSALLVAGVVAMERPWGHLWPRWTQALGDASYSLYLSHLLVLAAVGRAWRVALPEAGAAGHLALLVTAVLGACLVAVAAYRLLEVPVIARLRGALAAARA